MLSLEDINFLKNTVLRIQGQMTIPLSQFEALLFPKNDFKILGVYGRGVEGIVFKIEHIDGGFFALKLKYANEEGRALSEFYIQQEFAKYNMAPKLYDFSYQTVSFRGQMLTFAKAIMDPINSTLNQYLRIEKKSVKKIIPAIECLLKKKYLLMHPHPFLHCDMQFDNIVILKDGRSIGMIDFSYSARMPAILQILDGIPLIGSLISDNLPSCRQLATSIMKFYESMFEIQLDITRFIPLLHGGYCYMLTDKDFLHPYQWDSKNFYGVEVVRPEKLVWVFPQIKEPRVLV